MMMALVRMKFGLCVWSCYGEERERERGKNGGTGEMQKEETKRGGEEGGSSVRGMCGVDW